MVRIKLTGFNKVLFQSVFHKCESFVEKFDFSNLREFLDPYTRPSPKRRAFSSIIRRLSLEFEIY